MHYQIAKENITGVSNFFGRANADTLGAQEWDAKLKANFEKVKANIATGHTIKTYKTGLGWTRTGHAIPRPERLMLRVHWKSESGQPTMEPRVLRRIELDR